MGNVDAVREILRLSTNVAMLKVKHDHSVDRRELQLRNLTAGHFGRAALIVIVIEVTKADPMTHEADFTIGVPVQAGKLQADQRFEAAHKVFCWLNPLPRRRGS
jgi:hypothetical protein